MDGITHLACEVWIPNCVRSEDFQNDCLPFVGCHVYLRVTTPAEWIFPDPL